MWEAYAFGQRPGIAIQRAEGEREGYHLQRRGDGKVPGETQIKENLDLLLLSVCFHRSMGF